MTTWGQWWHDNVETIGITLAFATAGSGFLIWNTSTNADVKARQALGIWIAGQLVGASVAVILHGYFGVSPFVAPLAGLVSGLIGIPILRAISNRVAVRADDLVDKGIDTLTGSKGVKP